MTPRIVEGRLHVDAAPGGRWRLLDDVVVDLGAHLPELHVWALTAPRDRSLAIAEAWSPRSTRVRVPSGLETDFASVPILAQLVVGDRRRWRLAGLVHDLGYRDGWPRAIADAVFYAIARSSSNPEPIPATETARAWLARHRRRWLTRVGASRAWLGWLGLRIGGGPAYRAHARRRRDAALLAKTGAFRHLS